MFFLIELIYGVGTVIIVIRKGESMSLLIVRVGKTNLDVGI